MSVISAWLSVDVKCQQPISCVLRISTYLLYLLRLLHNPSYMYDHCVVQYYYECYCGDTYDRLGTVDNCDTYCSGNRTQTCGGNQALSVYSGCSCFGLLHLLLVCRSQMIIIQYMLIFEMRLQSL